MTPSTTAGRHRQIYEDSVSKPARARLRRPERRPRRRRQAVARGAPPVALDPALDEETLRGGASAGATGCAPPRTPPAPRSCASRCILGFDQDAVTKLINGADHPNSKTGRTLAGMLASDGNFLHEDRRPVLVLLRCLRRVGPHRPGRHLQARQRPRLG